MRRSSSAADTRLVVFRILLTQKKMPRRRDSGPLIAAPRTMPGLMHVATGTCADAPRLSQAGACSPVAPAAEADEEELAAEAPDASSDRHAERYGNLAKNLAASLAFGAPSPRMTTPRIGSKQGMRRCCGSSAGEYPDAARWCSASAVRATRWSCGSLLHLMPGTEPMLSKRAVVAAGSAPAATAAGSSSSTSTSSSASSSSCSSSSPAWPLSRLLRREDLTLPRTLPRAFLPRRVGGAACEGEAACPATATASLRARLPLVAPESSVTGPGGTTGAIAIAAPPFAESTAAGARDSPEAVSRGGGGPTAEEDSVRAGVTGSGMSGPGEGGAGAWAVAGWGAGAAAEDGSAMGCWSASGSGGT